MKTAAAIIENREKMYVKLENVTDFNVNKIFDCGQCFRFNPVKNTPHDVEFSGIAFGKFISVAQSASDVYIYNATAEDFYDLWQGYLALDVDYNAIKSDILSRSDNPALPRAVSFGEGIRILRQDSFEAVISFIISQNNNIPRIKKIIEALSKKCGKSIEIPEEMMSHVAEGCELYSFPNAEALLSLGADGLFDLKTGFRAKYIYDAAERFANGSLDFEYLTSDLSTKEAIEHLCGVKGIGPKVASCALLFGFARYDAFPIDVWIKKVIAKYFSADADFDPASLGPYAGIAQQYLFYYERYNQQN